MKRYSITILGRKYSISAEKDEIFMRRVESLINKELGALRLSMSHADYLDIYVVYLFQLYEKMDMLESRLLKMEKSFSEAKKIVRLLQEEITRELTNLTGSNKL